MLALYPSYMHSGPPEHVLLVETSAGPIGLRDIQIGVSKESYLPKSDEERQSVEEERRTVEESTRGILYAGWGLDHCCDYHQVDLAWE